MELTALDYIEIQQLISKYARALDTCSNNGYDYADLYTADGVFLPSVNGKQVPGIQGREKLAEVFQQVDRNFQALFEHPEFFTRTSVATRFADISHKVLR